MRGYIEGDMKAFERLYRRLSPKVYGFLRLRLQNKEDVDEVFQKVFSKVHLTRESYDEHYPVLQWLFVIAKSALLDHVKSLNRKERLKEEFFLSQNDPLPSLSHQMDESLLKGLGSEAKEIVKLRVIEELEYDEISLRVGKSEASIRQILSRSLKKLRLGFGGGK